MPPAPRGERISYSPSIVPGTKDIARVIIVSDGLAEALAYNKGSRIIADHSRIEIGIQLDARMRRLGGL